MTLPKGTYDVVPSDGDRGFDPTHESVDLTSDKTNVDFDTCKVEDATINGTMRRTGATSTAAETTTLQGSSTKNFVKLEYTPCGSGGAATVTLSSWVSRPQCESGGAPATINPYTKKPFQAYKPLRVPAGPYALDKGGNATLHDGSNTPALVFHVAKGGGSGTVTIYTASPSLAQARENELSGNSTMTCTPQAETLSLSKK